jgi:hypothetical protein
VNVAPRTSSKLLGRPLHRLAPLRRGFFFVPVCRNHCRLAPFPALGEKVNARPSHVRRPHSRPRPSELSGGGG